jgi:hypothetical protein
LLMLNIILLTADKAVVTMLRLLAVILVWIVDHHCLEVVVRFVDVGVNCWQ